MRGCGLRIDLDRALVQIPREGKLVGFEQCVGEVDERAQIARMMLKRFVIRQPRRAAITRVIKQRSQVSPRAQVRAVATNDLARGVFY